MDRICAFHGYGSKIKELRPALDVEWSLHLQCVDPDVEDTIPRAVCDPVKKKSQKKYAMQEKPPET